jgi:hypothetical protein
MATVSVPAEFFRGELRVYGDWREAFARELLQNSADAGARRVDIVCSDTDAGAQVTVTDDGCGMTADVLDRVFFALGRTTKTGPDSIGGFGRARIILCFAQRGYRLRTGHLDVDGAGGSYTVRTVDTAQPGCRFTIDLLDDTVDRTREAFRRLLRVCALPGLHVTVDGVEVVSRRTPTRAARVLRDAAGTGWARVYVTPGAGRLLVRVSGLMMFSRWLVGDDDVILELIPSRAREVLAASRDTLHTVYGDQLDAFVADLSRNRRRVLHPDSAPLKVRVPGGGFLSTEAAAQPGALTGAPEAGDVDRSGPSREQLLDRRPAAAGDLRPVTPWTQQPPHSGDPVGFDVFLLSDAADARVRRLARAWDPSRWTGGRRRALLLAWKAAVEVAMRLLLAHVGGDGVRWTVGWTFDVGVQAQHLQVGDGHVLTLNPVGDSGRAAFHLTRRGDRQRLLALALHEVAHVVVDGHDEAFAGLLTDLMAAVDVAAADRAIRSPGYPGRSAIAA